MHEHVEVEVAEFVEEEMVKMRTMVVVVAVEVVEVSEGHSLAQQQ
jgi:hypothetical protein